MPSASTATALGDMGCWVEWLIGDMGCWVEWLIGCSAVGCQNSPSWAVGCPNPSTWGSKSSKLGPKILQVGSPNHLKSIPGGLLERSWGHVGPKMAPRAKTSRKVKVLSPSWGPIWSPKSSKIDPKSDPKCDHFLIDLKIDFGSDLVPFWSQLGLPKPSQNEAKLALKSIQVGVLI